MNKKDREKKHKPILVTGCHRSGTTWIGKMISASPQVAYIHEPFNPGISKMFPGICSANFDRWYEYITNDNQSRYLQPIQKTLNFEYSLNRQLANNKCLGDYKKTIKDYCSFLEYRWKDSIPLIKDPFTLFSAEWLAKQFEMNIVINIRHPAAFISSIKRLNWNYNFSHFLQQPLLIRDYLQPFESEIREFSQQKVSLIEQGCLIWKIIYQTVHHYKAKYPHWIYLRYEDQAREPINSFEKLFKALELDFSKSVKTTVKNHCQSANSATTLNGEYYLEKFNSKSNIFNWKNKLDSAEIKQIRNKVEVVSHNFYSDSDW